MPDERRPLTASFEHFCACLNHFTVEYVVVGSEAVAFHGVPRYSVDFDTFVRATTANLFRVKAALERFTLNPNTIELKRDIVAEDPLYFEDKYVDSDSVLPADAPFKVEPCKELAPEYQQAGRK